MKPNLLDAPDREAILQRLAQLHPDSPRGWGHMRIEQMLAHCADQIRICLGEKPARPMAPAPVQAVVRWVFLRMNSMGRGMRTLREIDPNRGLMTPPTDFESDRRTLVALVERFGSLPETGRFPHPAFGSLTARQLGQLTRFHLDHHLRQFGV